MSGERENTEPRPVRFKESVVKRITEMAYAENRTFAGQVEFIVEKYLDEAKKK